MGTKIKFDIVGDKELVGKLYNIRSSVSSEVYKQSLNEVQEIMADSALEVPRDTNALANSQYISEDGNEIVFGYGGESAQINPKTGASTDDYAAIVHEDMHANHPVGKAKFLEDPINRHRANFENKIISKLKSIFGFLR